MSRSEQRGAGPEHEDLLDLRVAARADQLCVVRAAVRERLEGCGLSEESLADVVLAVDEACQNIIRHAYRGAPGGSMGIAIERSGDTLIFSLADDAPPVDPARIKPRDLDDIRPGGLGTHLIRKVMDEAEFIRPPSGRGNLLRMVKRIA